MAEARRLSAGLWRVYLRSERRLARHPRTGAIATFYTLDEARRWWQRQHPEELPLQEAPRCGGCDAYIDPSVKFVSLGGRSYHGIHAPVATDDRIVMGGGR